MHGISRWLLLWCCSFLLLPSLAAAEVTVGDLTLISSTRVSRVAFDYTYRVDVTNNTGDAVENVTATVSSTAPATTIIEANLSFPDIAAGATVTSTDTFTLRQDRRFPFDPNALGFDIQYTPVSDVTPPTISISSPSDGAVLDSSPVLVTGTASDDTALGGVTVNGVTAALSGDTFSASVPLTEGANTLTAVATDTSGNTASMSIQVTFAPLDVTPPTISISSPADGAVLDSSPVLVTGTASDDTALDGVTVNGVTATLVGNDFSASVPLAQGANTLTAVATDTSGNTASMSIQVTFAPPDVTPPTINIGSPSDGAVLDSSPVLVTGTASDDTALTGVTVNGVTATLVGNDFSASVPLAQGANTLTAVATDTSGNTASMSIQVTFAPPDVTPPTINIGSPADGAVLDSSPVLVTGTASDDTALDSVTVNGVTATVGTGGDFSASVPLSEGANTITAVATDTSGNTASMSIQVTFTPLDVTPPTISIDSPADGAVLPVSPALVSGSASDNIALDTVTVNGVPVTVSGGSYSVSVPLVIGSNSITALATDTSGNTASTSISVTLDPAANDVTPPQIEILSPASGALVIDSRPAIEVQATDDIELVPASLALSANGQPLPADCLFTGDVAQCSPTADLPEGTVTLGASVEDSAGNSATTQIDFVVDSVAIEIEITSPANGLITAASDIQVTGTASLGVAAVDVNGISAVLGGGGFSTTVPLREGRNMIVAVATKDSGRTGTDSVDVTRDIVAPIVSIDSPGEGFVSVNDSIAVTGKVNDIVSGGTDPRVLVNGVEATVAGGAYMVTDIPLVRGPNTISAVATDAVGNEGSRSISVTFQPPVGARMTEGAGNGQAALVSQTLTEPLVAVVQDDLGNPVAGRVVRFEVTRNSGNLQISAGAASQRILQVPTDGSGRAAVLFTLGDTAGEGNNRVRASAVGVAGEVEFCASGLGAAPDKILMVDGDNQRGVVGFPLANPLEALVIDKDGNPLNGVDVTFSVVQGTGNLDGQPTQLRTTGTDGIARAVLTLGLDAGINNNVVAATFPGLTGVAASFISSGLAPGNPAETSFRGVVLDNGQNPIPGAIVGIPNSSVVSVATDDEGQFVLEDVPVGHIHLHIDPTSSPRPETFPPLEFETVTIAGQANILGQPIMLPALQTEGSMVVGGSQDVTLSMPGVAGLELTVFANSVTCPDGSSQCQVTISQVHLDKVPMPPPSGTIFMPPAWTIQPAGTLFDPPARISIPNDGLPPGRVIDIFQFDHTLNEFINVGKGTVSDDASVIISDPGFGITRAGWGGCGQPQPPQTCTSSCDDGNRCTSDRCEDGSCVNEPIDTPQTAANMCEGCDNGMPLEKNTDAECCADDTVTGNPVSDAGTNGWVVCCNGTKTVCNKPYPPSYPLNDLLSSCDRKHEEQHFGDIDCPTGADECDTDRPGFKDGRTQEDGECDAYKVTIACLQAHDCMGDATCEGNVDFYVESYKNIANGISAGCIP